MSLAHQKQRMFVFFMLLILLSVVVLGLISFEVAQHLNTIWQAMHSLSDTAIISYHP